MSSLTFARSLFRDIESVSEFTKNVCMSGKRPQNNEITTLATTIKRAKQTCSDWELFASLQESNESNMTNLKEELNKLFQASVQAVKTPSSDLWTSVDEKFKILCNSISRHIGAEAVEQIEGLKQYINAEQQQNNRDSTELIKELKNLSMKALVDLKELSRIVLEAVRSRESTASHFAHAARSSAQTIQCLAIFATEVRKT